MRWLWKGTGLMATWTRINKCGWKVQRDDRQRHRSGFWYGSGMHQECGSGSEMGTGHRDWMDMGPGTEGVQHSMDGCLCGHSTSLAGKILQQ